MSARSSRRVGEASLIAVQQCRWRSTSRDHGAAVEAFRSIRRPVYDLERAHRGTQLKLTEGHHMSLETIVHVDYENDQPIRIPHETHEEALGTIRLVEIGARTPQGGPISLKGGKLLISARCIRQVYLDVVGAADGL